MRALLAVVLAALGLAGAGYSGDVGGVVGKVMLAGGMVALGAAFGLVLLPPRPRPNGGRT